MAVDNDLVIRLKLDKNAAEQSSQQWHQAERKRIQELLSDADVAERAKLELLRRANQQRIQEAARATKTELEIQRDAAKKRADDERKIAKETADAHKKALKDVEQAMRTSQREQIKAAQELARERAKAAKEAEKAALEAEKVAEEAAKKASREAIKAEQQKMVAARESARANMNAARDVLKFEQNRWTTTTGLIEGGTKALSSYGAQMIGLSSASSALNLVVSSFEKARDVAIEAVDTVVHYRQAIVELAALKGQLGGTTKTLIQDLDFRGKTLQSQEEANAFQQAALGVGESSIAANGRPGLITSEEFRRLMERSGAFQAAEGGSAQTHGRLAGMMPVLMGRNTTGEEAFAEEQVLYNIFKPGGGSFTQLTNQYLENAPLVTSGLINDRRAAALLSGFSVTNPGGAGTNLQQFARGTVGALGRMRGSGVEVDEKQAEYLKRLGANDQMDAVEIGTLISKDFEQQERAAAARGEKFNAMTYMRKHGYMNQEDIMALLAFHGLRKTGQWQNTFLPLTQQNLTPQEAFAPIAQAQSSEPALMERRVQLGSEAANIAAGAPMEYHEKLMRRAYDSMKARGKRWMWGSYEDYRKDSLTGGQRALEAEATRLLFDEYKQHGGQMSEGDFYRLATGEGKPWGTMGHKQVMLDYQETRARRFSDAAAEVQRVGGNALPGDAQLFNAASQSLNEAARQLNQAAGRLNQGRGPQPLQGRPPAQGR